MMTDLTLAKETRLFLLSIVVGVGLSLLYDLLRSFRLAVRERGAGTCGGAWLDEGGGGLTWHDRVGRSDEDGGHVRRGRICPAA